jgi:hypothetical protein
MSFAKPAGYRLGIPLLNDPPEPPPPTDDYGPWHLDRKLLMLSDKSHLHRSKADG